MALSLLAANNAQTVLAAGISSTATSITVNAGTGTLFPSPVAGNSFFKLTIIDAATGSLTEIVHVTARTGDVFTIQRGQEGTVPRAWSANDIAANMMTAGTLSYILGNFQPLDPTLTALAALVGVANKLPYFNGDDTAALTDLTQVGRDIIGKSSIADILTYLQLGDAAKSDVVQTTGQSEKDVISQKGATDNFALKALLDNFGGATLLFNKSRDYSLQLSDAGALSLYSKALDKVVLAFSKSGELQAGTIGFEHVKELKSAAKKDVGNSAGQIPDMSYFELSGIGSDNMIAKFPNGLIIQVFRRNISNSASVGVATINPVTFPTPFPGAVWGVFCTKMTYAQINTSCESVTNTGFSATTCAVSGVASTTLSSAVFLAVGY
ncbi:gp53-like domain-containing protein [Citrobacter freundii]